MYSDGDECERRHTKDVFNLLEELCISIAGTSVGDHGKLLREIIDYISNCPTALGSVMPNDEPLLATKIAQHLNNSTKGTSSSNLLHYSAVPLEHTPTTAPVSEDWRNSNSKLFLKLHDQLKTTHLSTRQRSAYIAFLYHLTDSKYALKKDGPDLSNINSCQYSNNHNKRQPISSQTAERANNQRSAVSHTQPLHKSVSQSRNISGGLSTELPPYYSTHYCRNNTSSMYKSSSATQRELQRIETDNNQILPGQYQEISQNIIYTFTGIPNKYLKKDVISGKFKLDTNARSFNVLQATMMQRLSEMGYYYDLVRSYSDPASGLCAIGLMGQGFVSALREELTKYYGMVAMLQEQFYIHNNPNVFCSSKSMPKMRERLTLLKILVWSREPLHRLKWIANIAKACIELKGGALASKVYSFLGNGEPMVKSLTKNLLLATCRPLLAMLTRWLLEGEFIDPFGEFFVECLTEIGPDRLWHEKYRVRTAMLPTFIPYEFAQKILIAGKSINFLFEVCDDRYIEMGRQEFRHCIDENAENIFAPVADTKLHAMIDTIYLNTSKRVLDIVMRQHKLLEHLHAMRRYLLLGQGDFIGILMETLQTELDKPAKELYSYDLSALLDSAIRTTNVQFDDPEILNYLDVRLLTPCDGEIGWDIVSLQYTVSGPLATMLEPSMSIYQLLFKPLWRMKHMEFVLVSKIWKEQKCNAKLIRPMEQELKRMLYRLHLFTSEMIHFINQMQYYILFEVIECSCVEMDNRIQQANTLDNVLHAHEDFLIAVRRGAFLESNSGELSQNLETVYEGINRLEVWQRKFYDLCFKELKARKDFRTEIERSEQNGQFGVTSEKQLNRDQDCKIFAQTLNAYHKSLNNIGSDYDKAVRCLLYALNSNTNLNLQLLGVRLDFNEYYKKRDHSIGLPLTFEHMRMSTAFYNNNNNSLNKSMRQSMYGHLDAQIQYRNDA